MRHFAHQLRAVADWLEVDGNDATRCLITVAAATLGLGLGIGAGLGAAVYVLSHRGPAVLAALAMGVTAVWIIRRLPNQGKQNADRDTR